MVARGCVPDVRRRDGRRGRAGSAGSRFSPWGRPDLDPGRASGSPAEDTAQARLAVAEARQAWPRSSVSGPGGPAAEARSGACPRELLALVVPGINLAKIRRRPPPASRGQDATSRWREISSNSWGAPYRPGPCRRSHSAPPAPAHASALPSCPPRLKASSSGIRVSEGTAGARFIPSHARLGANWATSSLASRVRLTVERSPDAHLTKPEALPHPGSAPDPAAASTTSSGP